MGRKSRTSLTDQALSVEILPGRGPIAQVVHPRQHEFNIDRALQTLVTIDGKLGPSVHVVITGGGFVTLEFPNQDVSMSTRRSAEFLASIRKWTRTQLSALVDAVRALGTREFLIGVDVMVGEHGSGQFGLWVGRTSSSLVSKRFPVLDEARHLAGVDAVGHSSAPRIVKSALGQAMVLVCHDAQAFNHRNRALVGRALRETSRSRAIDELDNFMVSEKPVWVWNIIHWIGSDGNLATFRKSHKQIYEDFGWHPKVVGAFGYEVGCSNQVQTWTSCLRQPSNADAVVVLIHEPGSPNRQG